MVIYRVLISLVIAIYHHQSSWIIINHRVSHSKTGLFPKKISVVSRLGTTGGACSGLLAAKGGGWIAVMRCRNSSSWVQILARGMGKSLESMAFTPSNWAEAMRVDHGRISIWLVVVYPPLWKRLEFVNWDDDINPIFLGKCQKWQPVTTNQPWIYGNLGILGWSHGMNSMDGFSWENREAGAWVWTIKLLGLSGKFSRHPILWMGDL